MLAGFMKINDDQASKFILVSFFNSVQMVHSYFCSVSFFQDQSLLFVYHLLQLFWFSCSISCFLQFGFYIGDTGDMSSIDQKPKYRQTTINRTTQ
jgi:hypothetical protein